MSSNRRNFSRVQFDSWAILVKDRYEVKASLIDIALKGALVKLDEGLDLKMHELCEFRLHFNGTDLVLNIKAELVYKNDQQMGFKFIEMELDTLTHLRRLLELNLGDSELVQRELSFF